VAALTMICPNCRALIHSTAASVRVVKRLAATAAEPHERVVIVSDVELIHRCLISPRQTN
jgi:hypothetical protein